MFRGVTKLDGARSRHKFGASMLHAWTWGLYDAIVGYYIQESVCDIVVTFCLQQWFGARRIVRPCLPSLRPWLSATNIGKFSKNEQFFKSELHELLFHEHPQFSNTMRHGLEPNLKIILDSPMHGFRRNRPDFAWDEIRNHCPMRL